MPVTLWPRRAVRDTSVPPARRAARADYGPTHACPHHVDAPAGVSPQPLRARRRPARSGPPAKRVRQPPPRAPRRRAPLRPVAASPAGTWSLLARGAGGLARSVARPEEAEPLAPEHRRDGVGLAVLGLAIVLGAAAWSNGIGPVGAGADRRRPLGHRLAGHGAAGRAVLRRPPAAAPRAAARGARPAGDRLGLRWSPSVLGIAQRRGRPRRPAAADRPASGGLIGWAVGTPLVAGMGAVVAVVLLVLLAFFGLLVITATPVHQIPERLRELADRLLGRDDYSRTTTSTTTSTTTRRRPTRRRRTRRSRRKPSPRTCSTPARSTTAALDAAARRRRSPPSPSTPSCAPAPAAGRRPHRSAGGPAADHRARAAVRSSRSRATTCCRR